MKKRYCIILALGFAPNAMLQEAMAQQSLESENQAATQELSERMIALETRLKDVAAKAIEEKDRKTGIQQVKDEFTRAVNEAQSASELVAIFNQAQQLPKEILPQETFETLSEKIQEKFEQTKHTQVEQAALNVHLMDGTDIGLSLRRIQLLLDSSTSEERIETITPTEVMQQAITKASTIIMEQDRYDGARNHVTQNLKALAELTPFIEKLSDAQVRGGLKDKTIELADAIYNRQGNAGEHDLSAVQEYTRLKRTLNAIDAPKPSRTIMQQINDHFNALLKTVSNQLSRVKESVKKFLRLQDETFKPGDSMVTASIPLDVNPSGLSESERFRNPSLDKQTRTLYDTLNQRAQENDSPADRFRAQAQEAEPEEDISRWSNLKAEGPEIDVTEPYLNPAVEKEGKEGAKLYKKQIKEIEAKRKKWEKEQAERTPEEIRRVAETEVQKAQERKQRTQQSSREQEAARRQAGETGNNIVSRRAVEGKPQGLLEISTHSF